MIHQCRALWREAQEINRKAVTDRDLNASATRRSGRPGYHADLVLTLDGEEIGFSAGRVVSATYRRMISLGFIKQAYATLGTEVTVVWGNPGTRHKRIRATVTRFQRLTAEIVFGLS